MFNLDLNLDLCVSAHELTIMDSAVLIRLFIVSCIFFFFLMFTHTRKYTCTCVSQDLLHATERGMAISAVWIHRSQEAGESRTAVRSQDEL